MIKFVSLCMFPVLQYRFRSRRSVHTTSARLSVGAVLGEIPLWL